MSFAATDYPSGALTGSGTGQRQYSYPDDRFYLHPGKLSDSRSEPGISAGTDHAIYTGQCATQRPGAAFLLLNQL